MSNQRLWGRALRWAMVGIVLTAGIGDPPLAAQESAGDTGAGADSAALSPSVKGPRHLPVFLVLGLGYGDRSDDCTLCMDPENTRSFTGHLSLGRPLGYGFGVSLDASVWRKGTPGTPAAPDSTGLPEATSLTNTLGNVSVSFSYDLWRLYLRAGGGLAWGSQDLEMAGSSADPVIHTASGWGVGYSVGGGITVPLASVVSLALFGNWNVGHYDLVSPQGTTERGVKHQYLELGAGLAMR